MKRDNIINKRFVCYLVCMVMAVTGTCTTSFANTAGGDGSADERTNDAQVLEYDSSDRDTENDELNQKDSLGERENANAITPLIEGYESRDDVNNIQVNLTGDMSTAINVGLEWNLVNHAESYNLYLNGKKVASGLTENKGEFSIVNPGLRDYTVSVSAVMIDEESKETEISNKAFVINPADYVATNTVIKLDTILKTSGTSQREYRSWATPKINDRYTTVAVNPDVNIEWDAAENAAEYTLVKYVTDSKGRINEAYEGVTPKGKYKSATSFWYREYVEEPVFKNKNSGYFTVKVLTKSSSDNNNVNVNGELYSAAGKYTSLNKATYGHFCMNKFLDEQIAEDNGTYIEGSATGRNYNGQRAPTVRTIKFYAKTNTRAKYYVKGSGNAGKGWLSTGTYGWTQGGSGSKFEFYTDSGRHGYVMRKKLSCYKIDYSPYVDWTAHKKENFVNKNARFNTSKKYVVWISRYSQTINVFKKNSDGKWELAYLAECTTGQFRNYTSGGDKKIHKRIKHRVRSKHHYYYLNCFSGLNSMHGPTYYKSSGNLKSNPGSHLGKNGMSSGTLGCVRTWNTDAKWIWDHCGIGTKVVVY